MRKDPKTAIVLVLLAMALGVVYGVSYWFLVERAIWVRNGIDAVTVPGYRHGGTSAEIAYWPAHQVDRLLRPGVWHESTVDVQSVRSEFRRFLARHGHSTE